MQRSSELSLFLQTTFAIAGFLALITLFSQVTAPQIGIQRSSDTPIHVASK